MLLTSFLDLVVEDLKKLRNRDALALLFCVLVLVVIVNGIAPVPHDYYRLLAQDPFTTRTDIYTHNYWQESVLLPVIAFYTCLTSRYAYYSLCLLILLIGYWALAHLMLRHYDSVVALIFTTLVITSPLTTVILSWLGTPDTLTFALTIPFLFTDSVALVFLGAVLGTMNHIAFAIAALEILILRWISQGKIKVYHLISATLGGISGYVLVRVFLTLNDIELITSRFDFILSRSLDFWARMNVHNFPVSVFSLFNVHWIVLFVSLIMFFKFDKVYYSYLLIILLLNYGIVFFMDDTTRVFSLLSWGVLVQGMFHSYKLALEKDEEGTFYKRQYVFALIGIALASFISPRCYSYGGNTFVPSTIYAFLEQLFNH